MQMKDGMRVNDDKGLEHEADVMGENAMLKQGEKKASPTLQAISRNCDMPYQLAKSRFATKGVNIKYMSGQDSDIRPYSKDDKSGTEDLMKLVVEDWRKRSIIVDDAKLSLWPHARYTKGKKEAVTQKDIKKHKNYRKLRKTKQQEIRRKDRKTTKTMTVGVHTRAWLHPDDPKKGTVTDKDGRGGVYQDLGYYTDGLAPLTACHLLNHDLGGAAVEQNLFPQTPAYNSEHKNQGEGHVKGKLASLIKGKSENPNRGLHVDVRVSKEGKPVDEGQLFNSREDFENTRFEMASAYTTEDGAEVAAPSGESEVHGDMKNTLKDWLHIESKDQDRKNRNSEFIKEAKKVEDIRPLFSFQQQAEEGLRKNESLSQEYRLLFQAYEALRQENETLRQENETLRQENHKRKYGGDGDEQGKTKFR